MHFFSSFFLGCWGVQVDAQSFPFAPVSYDAAGLVEGAYNPALTFSMSDVASLAAYAADRGVRLVIEVNVFWRWLFVEVWLVDEAIVVELVGCGGITPKGLLKIFCLHEENIHGVL